MRTRTVAGAILGVICLGVAVYYHDLWYRIGCKGDLKTGICTNPFEIIELQETAMAVLFAISGLAGITFGVLSRLKPVWRAACAAGIVFVTFVIFYLTGMQMESIGIRQCFLVTPEIDPVTGYRK